MQKIKSQKLSSHEVEEMNSEINVILVSVNFSFSGPPRIVLTQTSSFPSQTFPGDPELKGESLPQSSWNF